jgi:hypothetical protein
VTTARIDIGGGNLVYPSIANELPKLKCKDTTKYFIGDSEATAGSAVDYRNAIPIGMRAELQRAIDLGGVVVAATCGAVAGNFDAAFAGETAANVYAGSAAGCFELSKLDPTQQVVYCRTQVDYDAYLLTIPEKKYTILSDAKSDIAFASHFADMVAAFPYEAGFSASALAKARLLDAEWATEILATVPGKTFFATLMAVGPGNACSNWLAQNNENVKKQLARSTGISEDYQIDASLVGEVKSVVVYDFYDLGGAGEFVGPGALCCRDITGADVLCTAANLNVTVGGHNPEVNCGASASLPALW